ncbi:Dicer-like protein 1 [Mortierella sp. AD094]|nr:Dicer-like protein 1 [Mortierella sp. AD094]
MKPSILSALGEAFIKFFFGAYFFAHHQNDLEWPLTDRIQSEACISTMASIVVSSGLSKNICADQSSQTNHKAAEALRRVIAAAIACCCPDTAVVVAKSLGVAADAAISTIGDIQTAPGTVDVNTTYMVQEVQRKTGYCFDNANLLAQALSHESASLDLENQGLELLGDTVLEYVVADHYYKKRPTTPANDFKTFKSLILSNDALGSLFASLGFDNFLNTGCKDSGVKWRKDTRDVVPLRETGNTDWTDLHLSKKLGDAMEALVGVIFVDAGFSLGPVQDVLSRTLYPFIDGSDIKCPVDVKRGG